MVIKQKHWHPHATLFDCKKKNNTYIIFMKRIIERSVTQTQLHSNLAKRKSS